MPILKYWLLFLLVGCSAPTYGPAAWERILEDNLGSFYLPIYKKQKLAGEPTAWDYVADRPGAPNVLIIGDSISRGYTLPVRDALRRDFDVFRAPENAGATANGLRHLDIYLGTAARWDVIVFNFGIHDTETPPDVYRSHLRRIIGRLQMTGARLIWVRTTPFSDRRELPLNQIADAVMTDAGISAVTLADAERLPDGIHYPEPVYAAIAAPLIVTIRMDTARRDDN